MINNFPPTILYFGRKILRKSGPHTHFCPKCKQHKECPILTHCRRARDSVCMDCEYVDALTKDAKH